MEKQSSLNRNATVAEMDHVRLSRLLKLLPIEKIDITREPETGLVMITARDCFETEFISVNSL